MTNPVEDPDDPEGRVAERSAFEEYQRRYGVRPFTGLPPTAHLLSLGRLQSTIDNFLTEDGILHEIMPRPAKRPRSEAGGRAPAPRPVAASSLLPEPLDAEAAELAAEAPSPPTAVEFLEQEVPVTFFCPLSWRIMRDPVVDRRNGGLSWDRSAIEAHLQQWGTNPKTGGPMSPADLRPDRNLKAVITLWLRKYTRPYPPPPALDPHAGPGAPAPILALEAPPPVLPPSPPSVAAGAAAAVRHGDSAPPAVRLLALPAASAYPPAQGMTAPGAAAAAAATAAACGAASTGSGAAAGDAAAAAPAAPLGLHAPGPSGDHAEQRRPLLGTPACRGPEAPEVPLPAEAASAAAACAAPPAGPGNAANADAAAAPPPAPLPAAPAAHPGTRRDGGAAGMVGAADAGGSTARPGPCHPPLEGSGFQHQQQPHASELEILQVPLRNQSPRALPAPAGGQALHHSRASQRSEEPHSASLGGWPPAPAPGRSGPEAQGIADGAGEELGGPRAAASASAEGVRSGIGSATTAAAGAVQGSDDGGGEGSKAAAGAAAAAADGAACAAVQATAAGLDRAGTDVAGSSGSTGETFYGCVFVKPSAFPSRNPPPHLDLGRSLIEAERAAEMELARAGAAYATDAAEVAKMEERTAALTAARVAWLADQAAAAALRTGGGPAGTRRSSRLQRSVDNSIDGYHKLGKQPDADKFLREDGKKEAKLEEEYRPCLHAPGWEVNANGVVRKTNNKQAAPSRTTKMDGRGDVFARLSLRPKGGAAKKAFVDRSIAVKNLVALAWRPDLAAKVPFDGEGGLRKGVGEWRIGHSDGNKFNNSAANLILVPAKKPK